MYFPEKSGQGCLLRFAILASAVVAFGGVSFAGTTSGAYSETEVVGRYLAATQAQQSALRGASMEVDIDANVPKLKKTGKLHALRNISKIGTVTYHMLGFNGDNSVKKEVIARYLAAETEQQGASDLGINPANYRFKFKGIQPHEGHSHYVLAVSPRKKTVGLFKGELWLDEETFMPVREQGRFVKTPSVFLKSMTFVRTYELRDGVSIPQQLASTADTRLFGPVELNIRFTHFAKGAPEEVASAAGNESQN